jgi:hypothetical protein
MYACINVNYCVIKSIGSEESVYLYSKRLF